MKIVYCVDSIKYLGGIQRVTIVKANALASIPSNDVYIVVADNKSGVMLSPLSDKVHLVDLNVNYYEDDWKSKFYVIKGIIIKRKEHKKKLKTFLNHLQPDVVISVGLSEKNFLPLIKGPWLKIREFHIERNYRLDLAQSFFQRVVAVLGNICDNFFLKKYDRIVSLTKEDVEKNWKGCNNVVVVPNPITVKTSHVAELKQKQVVALGRLNPQKNFASLIRSFKIVANTHPDWVLVIYGDGDQKEMLLNLIEDLGLKNNVKLPGYTGNVTQALLDSSIFAVSSVFEGFSLAILEAMACGVPVVSYACPCGPRDLIREGVDGFLVPVNNENLMADRLNYFIENENARIEAGRNAKIHSLDFSLDNVTKIWMDLFISSLKSKKS